MTTEPTDPGRRPQVLFVCVHNAGRSQMAAALLELHAAGRVDVRSAGSSPSPRLTAILVDRPRAAAGCALDSRC